MPETQSVLLGIRDGMTVDELLGAACGKGQLPANDYFLRFQASLDSPEYYVAPRTELLDNLVSSSSPTRLPPTPSPSPSSLHVYVLFVVSCSSDGDSGSGGTSSTSRSRIGSGNRIGFSVQR